jgi:hypothetical protein
MTEIKKPTCEKIDQKPQAEKNMNGLQVHKVTHGIRKSVSRSLEERQNEPFDLDEQLLADYPEMQKLSGVPIKDVQQDVLNASQIYVNGRTLDSYIQSVINKKPSGDIEYHLRMVEDGLNKLKAQNNPDYQDFITKESAKLEVRKDRAERAIGDKKRDMNNMGIYE